MFYSFLVAGLLLSASDASCSLGSSFEFRLTDKCMAGTDKRLPLVLVQLIVQYAVPTPSQPVLIVNTENTSYQRSGTTFRMFVIGKNPAEPKLPLCLRFDVPFNVPYYRSVQEPKPTHQEIIPCPEESWYPEQLTRTFTELYRKVMYHQNILRFETGEFIPIEDKSNSAACIRAPYITEETLDIFLYLSKSEITFVNPDFHVAQAVENLTLVYLAPGLTLRSLAQLQKNIYIYCTRLCSNFPNKRFPLVDTTLGWGGLTATVQADRLNNIMDNYSKQKDSIARIISQAPWALSKPLFLKGCTLSNFTQYAEKRKGEYYKAHW